MFRKLGIAVICAVMLAVLFSPSARAETPFTAAQRQEEEKAADTKLKELNKKMDELVAQSKKATGQAQAEINRLYEEFKKKQGIAGKELEELRRSTNETWEKAKGNMDKALDNLNGLYERSKAKSKDTGEAK